MTLYRRIFKNSTIYAFAETLQKLFAFFLLPLYTRYLTPEEYGVTAVVTSITIFLEMVFLLSLNSAATRYYFEYRNDKEKLAEFWGTLFTFVSIFSLCAGVFLILTGKYYFGFMLGGVSFFPYMAIGIAGAIFFPIFEMFLSVMQTMEKSKEYGIVAVISFTLKLIFTVSLVIGLGMRAEGPLLSTALISFIFFFVSYWRLKNHIKICLKWVYLKEAFAYSLPLFPHSVVTQVKNITDRIFINNMVNTAATGLYNIGFSLASAISIVSIAVNRAFIPVFMNAMKTGDEKELSDIKNFAAFIVFFYCILSLLVSLFAQEAIMLITTESFYESYIVVPFIAFYFASRGIYFLFVNTLFYYKDTTKFVFVGTLAGTILNIAFNYFFILWWGIKGSAFATMLSQIIIAVIIAWIAHKYTKISWDYTRYSIAFILTFSVSAIGALQLTDISFVSESVKIISFIIVFLISSAIMWKSPFYLLKHGRDFYLRMTEKYSAGENK